MTRIVPAILTDRPEALETMVRQAEKFASYVQFDIMDGRFVPSRSITASHLAGLKIKFAWEAHLMLTSPERYLQEFRKAGAGKVIFHYEATSSPREVIARARQLGLKVGIAINPETPIADVSPLAEQVDSVLFLSVHPGFYGAKFIPKVLDKIADFRSKKPGKETGIDGGVKASNVEAIAQTGVDTIFVGSAIFMQPEPADSFRQLTALVSGKSSRA